MSRKKHQQRAKQPQRRKAVQRGGQPFTALQRASALAGLHRFVEAPRQQLWVEAAAATFWGPWPRPRQEEGVELDAVQARSDAAFFLWLLLDCQMAQGKRAVEIFLEQSRQLEPGERVCLEQLAGSDVRLWEVRRIIPGPAYELRELLNSEQLTVRSTRTMTPLDRWEVVAGRVVRRGAPGEAELEAGELRVPRPWRRGLTAWLERRLAGADGRGQLPDGERASTQAYREALPGLHQEWLRQASDPAVAPRAGWVNGVAPLAWRARLPVADGQQLGDALDSLEQLSREEDQPVWIWCLPDSEGSGFAEVQGILRLERSQLVIDAAAEEQARQAAAFVEATAGQALGGPAVLRRVPPASLQQAAGSRLLPEEPLALPVSRPLLQRPEVKQALVSFFERWYRRWIELPLPLLGGASPQAAAAGSPANRGRLKGLLGDLAHGYEQSLRQMEPAFDPSWLWRELGQGLAEDVDSPDRRPSRPPVLGHEAIRRFVPGIGEAAARIAARRRSRSDFTRDTVLTRDELGDDPDFDSFLAAHGKLMHRFMVRGHWRRPAASWKEQRPRWIEPYWKGPDMAAIVEREYRLKP